jgi:ribosomal protein S28E/S33
MVEKNIEGKVVKVLQEQPTRGGTNQLRIMRWIVDGKDTGALLEKRNLFVTPDGMEKMGKAKGFNKNEVQYIVDHWAEIESLMQ